MLFNNDFTNIEMIELPNDEDHWGLRFKDLGLSVKINKISFSEQEDKTCVMHLSYDIIDGELKIPKNDFKKIIGDVVFALLEDRVAINEAEKTLKLLKEEKQKEE